MMRVDHRLCTENALNFVVVDVVVDEDIPSRLILFWMKLLFVFVFYFVFWFICFFDSFQIFFSFDFLFQIDRVIVHTSRCFVCNLN